MQKYFEKIKERLIAGKDKESSSQVPKIRLCDAIKIVNQVAEEYNQSLANNNQSLTNDGWVPCSSGKMPDNGKECWITYEWKDGTLHVESDFFVDGNWFETDNEAVKAWKYRGIPAPYQPKGE